jgi:hypothetical protein
MPTSPARATMPKTSISSTLSLQDLPDRAYEQAGREKSRSHHAHSRPMTLATISSPSQASTMAWSPLLSVAAGPLSHRVSRPGMRSPRPARSAHPRRRADWSGLATAGERPVALVRVVTYDGGELFQPVRAGDGEAPEPDDSGRRAPSCIASAAWRLLPRQPVPHRSSPRRGRPGQPPEDPFRDRPQTEGPRRCPDLMHDHRNTRASRTDDPQRELLPTALPSPRRRLRPVRGTAV